MKKLFYLLVTAVFLLAGLHTSATTVYIKSSNPGGAALYIWGASPTANPLGDWPGKTLNSSSFTSTVVDGTTYYKIDVPNGNPILNNNNGGSQCDINSTDLGDNAELYIEYPNGSNYASYNVIKTVAAPGSRNIYLAGEVPGWGENADYKFSYDSSNGVYVLNNVTLEVKQSWEGSTPKFKIIDNGTWYGYDANEITSSNSTVTLSSSGNNCYLQPGTYSFTYNANTHQLTVTGFASDTPITHTYTVAGSSTDLFGTTWDASNSTNDMTDNGDGTYTWTSAAANSSETVTFKVVVDNNWDNAYPSSDYEIGVPAGHTLTVTFDSSDNSVNAYTTGTPVYHVVGNNSTLFGAEWSVFQSAGAMTLSDGLYTWSYGPVASEVSGLQFKVVKNGTWATAYPSSNIEVTIPANHSITITYNPTNDAVNYVLTDMTPVTYTVAGSSTDLFGTAWDATLTANDMTDNGDGTYTWTSSAASTSQVVEFKVAKNHDFNVAAYPADNYQITVPAGHTLTVTFDSSDNSVSATTSGPNVYTVVGEPTDIFGGSSTWQTLNPDAEMTLNSTTGLYEWISDETTANQSVALKVAVNCSWDVSYPEGVNNNVNITVPKGYKLKVTYNPSTNEVLASLVDTHPINLTGDMYVIGQVGGNPWVANMGMKMTPNADNTVFVLNNVQIVAGATFAFATALGATDDDWTTLQQYRLTSMANDDLWVVTSEMTDHDNPQALALQQWRGDDKSFKMGESARYDITVDLNARTVTIKRRYGTLYMFYGDHWDPSNGVSMITHDGYSYILSDVALSDGSTFQFATELSATSGDWSSIADKRLGSNATDDQWIVNADMIGTTMTDAMLAGSTKNFTMGTGTAGTYRVVVNPSLNTVTLFKMAEVLDGKMYVHLEQTSNVTNPLIWAYDKERTPAPDEQEIHVDRPSRTEIATNRLEVYLGAPNAPNDTTADGRVWWTWELNKPMTDFWFTRGSYSYNKSDDTNADMTDINWRKSGEIYLTWPDNSTTLDDYTRDYYEAAAHEAPVVAVMIEGHLYVYFVNTPGWENVFCHAWYTDEFGVNHDLLTPPSPYTGAPTYPGALCELVGYDSDGYSVWRMDLTAAGITTMPNGILFNNGISGNHDYASAESESTTTKSPEQSSDNVYANGTCYDYTGVVVLGSSLASLINSGVVDGPVYTVEDDLIAVYFDPNAETVVTVDGVSHTLYGALYCKDKNNFTTTSYVERSIQKDGQVDYMKTNYQPASAVPDRYDQSNWVKLTVSTLYPGYVKADKDAQLALLQDYVGYVIPGGNVRGQLTDTKNPTMHLALSALPAYSTMTANSYYENPNIYVTSNFLGNQTGTDKYGRETEFFFVTPKPNEYATISWAVYGGNNKFYIPTSGWYDYQDGQRYSINGYDLNGCFSVQWDLQDEPSLQTGQLYSFTGIIRMADETGGGAGVRRKYGEVSGEYPYLYKTNVTSSPYTVSPINLSSSSIITSVEAVEAVPAQVESVKYIDLMGHESDRPFQGVNIVVTRYTDGSTHTAKELR